MTDKIKEILQGVKYPGFSKDIVAFGFVKNIEASSAGAARIDLEITSSAKEVSDALRQEITQKLAQIGVTDLALNIKAPQDQNAPQAKNIAPSIKNFVMVSSGKGGVGKSTTTVNLAIACAAAGKKVGILDADIYGPNIPRMMGQEGARPEIVDNKIKPLFAHGVEFISMGNLIDEGQALIWRGAMIIKTVTQLLTDVLWGDLDILFIDMPPGTGDAQLTLAQSVPVTAGVVVTTPQVVALDDAKRSLNMFEKLNIPIGGVIENMSGFVCPESGKEYEIFGRGTAKDLAAEYSCDCLGEIPIELAIRQGGDAGKPITIADPSGVSANRYMMAADILIMYLAEVQRFGRADNSAIQPTVGGSCHTH